MARLRRQARQLEAEYDGILVNALDALEDAERIHALWQRMQEYEAEVAASVEADHQKIMSRIAEQVKRGEATNADLADEVARVGKVYAAMDEARAPAVALDTPARVEEAWNLLLEVAAAGASASQRLAARAEVLAAEQKGLADKMLTSAQEQWAR